MTFDLGGGNLSVVGVVYVCDDIRCMVGALVCLGTVDAARSIYLYILYILYMCW